RQDAVFHETDHTVLRILIKFSRHVPDFPIYSNGTKPGALHIDELDGTFYSGLIPRFSRPGRNKQDVVIVGEVRVAFLDASAGVVLHRPIAGCWCVIGHDDARAFAEVVQDFDVAGNPVVHCPELARV
ncbi:hypothetical protein, partial [Corynebacterium striatum]